MEKASEELIVRNFASLQKRLEEYCTGKEPQVATAAAFYVNNLVTNHPVEVLATAWPFTEAIPILYSAGLISRDGRRLTEKGWKVYNFLE